MEDHYKRHFIRTDSRGNTDGWRPIIQVSWTENDAAKMRIWVDFEHSFGTRTEAEIEGHRVAIRWIEDGKP
jgi:hypothetical protein